MPASPGSSAPGVRHLFPADRRQADIRPMQIREQRAIATGFPAQKYIQQITGPRRVGDFGSAAAHAAA